jgi:hypothetical protein
MTFGLEKKNFDEIDRAGFGGFVKKVKYKCRGMKERERGERDRDRDIDKGRRREPPF